MNKYQQEILKNIETRLRTIMIGSLSRIEKHFGYLWNYGDDMETKNHEIFSDKWEDLRLEILNHGNNQIRAAIDDMEMFFNKENKYAYNYKFVIDDNHKKNRR
jgi:hypothetical protein